MPDDPIVLRLKARLDRLEKELRAELEKLRKAHAAKRGGSHGR